MSKFTKHIGTGEPIKINEEEFILKPLTTEYIPDFFRAMKAFSGAKEDAGMEDILKNIDDAGLDAIKNIIEATLLKSYPDENKEEMKVFGLRNMSVLLPKIFEINSAQSTDSRAKEKIDSIKRMRQNKDATTPTD